MNEALQAELLAMAEHDLRVRAELVSTGELFDGDNARMAAVHKQNAENIERIIEEYGWPGVSLVGDEGAEAAWLVVQHAIENPELQRKCLPLLKKAAVHSRLHLSSLPTHSGTPVPSTRGQEYTEEI